MFQLKTVVSKWGLALPRMPYVPHCQRGIAEVGSLTSEGEEGGGEAVLVYDGMPGPWFV